VASRRNLIIIGLAAWIVLVMVAIGWWQSGEHDPADHVELGTPREAATSFYKCLDAGHIRDVLFCVLDDAEQRAFAEALAEGAARPELSSDDLLPIPPLDVTSLPEPTIDGDVARLRVPTADLDDARPSELVLRRGGDGRWRVDLFETSGLTPQQAAAYAERLRASAPLD
jgi:hypothetical protein